MRGCVSVNYGYPCVRACNIKVQTITYEDTITFTMNMDEMNENNLSVYV
jgi:hypothetical protein